jgi:hypothetical protein
MKIDFKKIIKIKKKKDLINYKLDKPIFLNNYLFHYLIIFKNLKGLKLYNFPIFIENNNNLNGFHLAAKEYDYKILCYLIDTYPTYIYNKNKYNETFINYIPPEEIIKLLIKYPNLKWNDLIEPENDLLIRNFYLNLNYKNLNKFITLYNSYSINNQHFIWIILSNILNIEEKILLLDNIPNKYLNNSDIMSYIPNNINKNEKLIIYLLNRNVKFDFFTHTNFNPFRFIINYDILNNKNELSFILLNKLISTHDKSYNILDITDMYINNLLHFIFYTRINNKNIKFNNYKIDNFLIKLATNENLNQTNTISDTPLELVSLLDYDIYSKLLLKIKNISINKKNLNKIKNDKWYKLFNNFPNYNDNNNVSIKEYKYSHYSTYNSGFIDTCIYTIYLKNKYNFLYIPIIKNYTLNNLLFDDNINLLNHYSFNNPIYPWFIVIKSSTEFYIHPYLNNLINSAKNNKKYRYSFINIFIYNNNYNSAHANCLIYNFEKLTIERFEPYGNISNYNIDELLEEQLTWNTGFKYINPQIYQPLVSFQLISDEYNFYNKKYGDPGGFCLAWCYWYVETFLLNENVDSKILITKLIKKINNLDINFMEYIRNYSNILTNEKIKFLKLIKFTSNKISNKYYNNIDFNYIMNHIIKYFNS